MHIIQVITIIVALLAILISLAVRAMMKAGEHIEAFYAPGHMFRAGDTITVGPMSDGSLVSSYRVLSVHRDGFTARKCKVVE